MPTHWRNESREGSPYAQPPPRAIYITTAHSIEYILSNFAHCCPAVGEDLDDAECVAVRRLRPKRRHLAVSLVWLHRLRVLPFPLTLAARRNASKPCLPLPLPLTYAGASAGSMPGCTPKRRSTRLCWASACGRTTAISAMTGYDCGINLCCFFLYFVFDNHWYGMGSSYIVFDTLRE